MNPEDKREIADLYDCIEAVEKSKREWERKIAEADTIIKDQKERIKEIITQSMPLIDLNTPQSALILLEEGCPNRLLRVVFGPTKHVEITEVPFL